MIARTQEHRTVCSRRDSADLRRIASLLLLRIPRYPSSSRLALLATRRNHSVRKLFGALAVLALFSVVACGADPDSLLARRSRENNATSTAALTCTDKPAGRSYTGFDGNKLEDSRVDEATGVNRARIKPYSAMGGEYARVLGAAPDSLASSASSFDDPPVRWYAEASLSGVSLNASFSIAFDACLTQTAGATFAAAPTPDTATTYCTETMRKTWSQSGSPDEISGCVDLATTKLSSETDPHKQWAYVCSSILSSTHFLTF